MRVCACVAAARAAQVAGLRWARASTRTRRPRPLCAGADLFRAKTGLPTRFRVALDKRVPHGAGLGGGSGNAATALWAANELCGRPATDAQLLAWAGEIGSDISVFFSRGAAYCTGRGEVVEDVPPPLPLSTPLLLVKPPVGLSTPAVFKALDLGRRSAADPRQLLAGLAAAGRLSPPLCVQRPGAAPRLTRSRSCSRSRRGWQRPAAAQGRPLTRCS